MNAIKRMSADVINQIAAGEVIRRPASVVKELVENSLDAGATAITLTLEQGGLTYIAVQDNGHGMSKADLALVFQLHTTSKLTSLQDLLTLGSFGFRGEALASIQSVSKCSVQTTQSDAEHGWQAIETAGQVVLTPTAAIPGTTIIVRDLFHHLPARRKFLRSEHTEYTYIEEVVRAYVLAYPEKKWTVIHNGKQVKHFLPCQNQIAIEQRIAKYYGHLFIENCRFVEHKTSLITLTGWIATTMALKRTSKHQMLFVNKRPIKDRGLSAAIRHAYDDLCPPGYQPTYILFLTVSSAELDVNVHPAKTEIHFEKSRQIYGYVTETIKMALREPVDTQSKVTPFTQFKKQQQHVLPVSDVKEEYSSKQQQLYQPSNISVNRSLKSQDSLPKILSVIHKQWLILQVATDVWAVSGPHLHAAWLEETLARSPETQELLFPQQVAIQSTEMVTPLSEWGWTLQVLNPHKMMICRLPKQIPTVIAVWLLEHWPTGRTIAFTDYMRLLQQGCIEHLSFDLPNTSYYLRLWQRPDLEKWLATKGQVKCLALDTSRAL